MYSHSKPTDYFTKKYLKFEIPKFFKYINSFLQEQMFLSFKILKSNLYQIKYD